MVLCLASFQTWIQGTFLQNGYLSSKDVQMSTEEVFYKGREKYTWKNMCRREILYYKNVLTVS